MVKIRAYNAAAAIDVADYAERALRFRRGTTDRMTETRKAIDLSQALIANIDALVTDLARDLTKKGWLWPAYQSAPSEPEMEAEPRSAAQWRDGAQDALVRAETMRDPDARRMMRELAMHYENLAAMVEKAVLLRQDKPDRDKFLP
jgi:hypothetical protein